MNSLKHKTISGIKWTMAASVVQRIISFGTTVVLARILSPADFGLFALAFVMIDGFGIFKSLGFDSALVRRKDEDIDKACNTAFFLIPAMGMILFVILFFFAPIGAQFLNNPQVTPLIRTLAIVFVISTFGKVPQTILYRSMKFKYKSIAELSAAIVYSTMALVLAFNKMGVWSLVVAYILKTLTQSGIEWYFSGWKPRLFRFEKSVSTQIYADQTQIPTDNSRSSACNSRPFALKDVFSYRIKFEFDKSIAWDMFHFGKYVLASGIIGFLYSNLDNIAIGKILGVAMLGYYAISMNTSNFLSDYFLNKVGMVMYPAYSRIQEDTEDVKSVMLKALRYISIVVFPFGLALSIFAPDILRLVFGPKWLPATNILRILAFVGILRALGSTIWPVFFARGKSRADFQVSLVQVCVFFILVIPLAIKFKLLGVCFTVLISSIISFVIGFIRIERILHIGVKKLLSIFKPAFFSSLLMLVGTLFLKLFPITKIYNYDFLISGIGSVLIYLLAMFFMNKNIFRDMREALI